MVLGTQTRHTKPSLAQTQEQCIYRAVLRERTRAFWIRAFMCVCLAVAALLIALVAQWPWTNALRMNNYNDNMCTCVVWPNLMERRSASTNSWTNRWQPNQHSVATCSTHARPYRHSERIRKLLGNRRHMTRHTNANTCAYILFSPQSRTASCISEIDFLWCCAQAATYASISCHVACWI